MASFDDDPPPEPRRRPFQRALFTTRELGKVVPIESLQPAARSRGAAHGADRTMRASEPVTGFQQSLFAVAPAIVRGRSGPPRSGFSARYSKAPVASPIHRVLAAVADLTLVAVAVGVVAISTHAMIGLDSLGDSALPFYGALYLFFAISYKLLWAMADSDSPGLGWTHLRLLTFDGVPPTRDQRLRRLCWSVISILPAGLGLLWALVDEEKLSWHDHSSKTFLSPDPHS